MTEKEIVEVFVHVQEPEYYDRIMLLVGAKFAEIVKIGLLKKKREEVAAISYGRRKTPRSSSYSQGHSRPSPKSYQSCYTQSSHPNNQNTTSVHPNVQAPVIAPNCANVQSNYRAPPPVYQLQAPLYQDPPPNYQAPSPNYQTNPYPKRQAPRPNTRNNQQVPPP
ncbi:velvet complex subunit B-like [Solanum pennellii]|uniref:Velvet complex subunit B-like n=1 Tax=Solanum pennellii TaxID=28526 RepID=A0ABM1GZA8_SOLPN|nr:velvet complex subunit B-like [Solanum pennellii]